MHEEEIGRALEVEVRQLEQPFAELRIRTREQVARLTTSILAEGQRTPLAVVAAEHPDGYVVIDGHARVAALAKASQDLARVLVLPLTATDALIFWYRFESGPRRTALEQGWLVRELASERSLGEIAHALGRSKSWVSRRLGLVEALPERVQAAVRRGHLSSHAAMRSLLPLARANAEAAERLADAASKHELTSRQLEALCRGYQAASGPGEREEILSRPALYLEALKRLSAADPKSRPPLVRDFELLAAIARRSERLLRSPSDVETGATEALTVTWARTEHALHELMVAIEERTHVGLGHSSGHPSASS